MNNSVSLNNPGINKKVNLNSVCEIHDELLAQDLSKKDIGLQQVALNSNAGQLPQIEIVAALLANWEKHESVLLLKGKEYSSEAVINKLLEGSNPPPELDLSYLNLHTLPQLELPSQMYLMYKIQDDSCCCAIF